jgi:hypothetical protein
MTSGALKVKVPNFGTDTAFPARKFLARYSPNAVQAFESSVASTVLSILRQIIEQALKVCTVLNLWNPAQTSSSGLSAIEL